MAFDKIARNLQRAEEAASEALRSFQKNPPRPPAPSAPEVSAPTQSEVELISENVGTELPELLPAARTVATTVVVDTSEAEAIAAASASAETSQTVGFFVWLSSIGPVGWAVAAGLVGLALVAGLFLSGVFSGNAEKAGDPLSDANRPAASSRSEGNSQEQSAASSRAATNSQANTATQQSSNSRYEVQESQGTAKNSGGSFRSSPAGGFQENDAIVGKWSTRDSNGTLSNLGLTITKKGNGVFVASNDAYPNFDGCAAPLLIHQTGPTTYVGSNTIRPQGCYDNTSEFEVNGNRMTIKSRLINKLNDSDNTYHSTAERVGH